MFEQVEPFCLCEREGRHLYRWVFQIGLFIVIGPSLETSYKLDQ